jgi:hypothetical protein
MVKALQTKAAVAPINSTGIVIFKMRDVSNSERLFANHHMWYYEWGLSSGQIKQGLFMC